MINKVIMRDREYKFKLDLLFNHCQTSYYTQQHCDFFLHLQFKNFISLCIEYFFNINI